MNKTKYNNHLQTILGILLFFTLSLQNMYGNLNSSIDYLNTISQNSSNLNEGQISNAVNCDLKVDFKYEIIDNVVNLKAWTQTDLKSVQLTWNMGDGTKKEGEVIGHQYTISGEYKVCLMASVPSTSSNTLVCTETVCKIIKIETYSGPCNIRANFKMEVLDNIVHAIAESNAGKNAQYIWRFSDGSRYNGAEIKHRFTTEGEYEICLTVSHLAQTLSQNCSVTVCRKVVIKKMNTDETCPIKAEFTQVTSVAGIGFRGRSNADDAVYSWAIEGMKNTYSGKNVNIPLTRAGVYKVCLTVSSRKLGCKVQICKRIIIGKNNGTISTNDVEVISIKEK